MRKYLFVVLVSLVATPLWAGDPACEEQCNLDYWTCSDTCGPFGGALCEQQCVDAQNACLRTCELCPFIRNYSTTTLLSSQQTGARQCMEDYLDPGDGAWYWQYFIRYRVTNYRETTNCDGSKTTVVLSSYTSSAYCYNRSPFTNDVCYPYSPRFNLCF